MGQDLVLICDKCRVLIFCNCRFSNISKSEVQEFFYNHKGHSIRAIGDDGGWEITIDKLLNDMGYQRRND